MGSDFLLYNFIPSVGWCHFSICNARYPSSDGLLIEQKNEFLFATILLHRGRGRIWRSFLSFLGNNLPTGPLIVLVLHHFFILVLFFRPEKGLFLLWLKSRSENSRIAIENTLKAAYQIIEKKRFQGK